MLGWFGLLLLLVYPLQVVRLDYFEGGDAPAIPLPRVTGPGH